MELFKCDLLKTRLNALDLLSNISKPTARQSLPALKAFENTVKVNSSNLKNTNMYKISFLKGYNYIMNFKKFIINKDICISAAVPNICFYSFRCSE